MRPIELDFAHQPRNGLKGLGLLVLGAVLLAALLYWDQVTLQPQIDEREAQLESVRQAGIKAHPEVEKGIDRQLSADIARAMAVSAELNLPWERLFASLEESAGRNVALLTLEPDAVKHTLTLSAEARNFKAMLAFYRKLQAQPNLHQVNLHAHQTNEQDDERPIRFRISCSWQEAS